MNWGVMILMVFFGVSVECVEKFVIEKIENEFWEIMEIKILCLILRIGFFLVLVELEEEIYDIDGLFFIIWDVLFDVEKEFFVGVVFLIFDDDCGYVYIVMVVLVWEVDSLFNIFILKWIVEEF